jgi:hypothetical protein
VASLLKFLAYATSPACTWKWNSCATEFWPVNRLLSLVLLSHICLLRIAWPKCRFQTWLAHCEALLWIIFRTGLGQEHSSPTSPIMKPVPKRLRTYFDCETNPRHLQGLLPARSSLNDLVRLRGAIIASCICGATKELCQSPATLTFLVRWPGLGQIGGYLWLLVVNSATLLLASVPVPSPCPEST